MGTDISIIMVANIIWIRTARKKIHNTNGSRKNISDHAQRRRQNANAPDDAEGVYGAD